MRPAITVTVVTLNEGGKLDGCLRSVSWADEVVVLDSGSTDATESIALAHGARYERQEWLGYAAQKNRAADLATHDWILNVDADERIGQTLHDAVVAADYGAARAFTVHRVSDFLGRPHRPIHRPARERLTRLYDRRAGRFNDDLVHEKVEVDGRVAALTGTLFHEGFRGLEDLSDRLNRYSTLLAQQRPPDASALRIAGRPILRLAWTLLRHGLLRDGRRGLIHAALWAHHDLLVEAKRYEAALQPGPAFDERLYARASERPAERSPR